MTKLIARDPIYRRRVFDAEIIELCVRWYITYRLSYRDLVGMMVEADRTARSGACGPSWPNSRSGEPSSAPISESRRPGAELCRKSCKRIFVIMT